MSLLSRFSFTRTEDHLHSSGMVGNSSTIGATSAESFQQRQQVDQGRQFIRQYRDAGVLYTYKRAALQDTNLARPVTADEKDDHKRHKKKLRSQSIPRSSRIEHVATSRIDHPQTSRIDVPERTSMPTAGDRPVTNFKEPAGRRYNPYV